ncbi:hypothetical protein COK47_02585 [Bacillus cereus]|uniref:hypothetical protein n=1 Tax=Bacillus cereus TaxID=1396 RepID=UPI000BF779A0|nr:hypothetical protein [Bacillus cereus]MEB8805795.1 hypothetical protein [Bacillus cereus]PFL46231.1 hypothetical protein COJ33_28030 [Bacillus cereus]PFS35600.1 hypothetical protein COK47_02585 [Bacillus cereus]
MGEKAKVVELLEHRNRKVKDDDNGGGGGGMSNYATHKDLDNLKNELNNSLKLTEKNIQLMFRDEREYHRKNKNESVRWIIGTGIGVTGIILTFIKLFVMS